MRKRSDRNQSRTSSSAEADESEAETARSRTSTQRQTAPAYGQPMPAGGAAVDAPVQRVPQAAQPQQAGLSPTASARAAAIRERFENRPDEVPDDNSRQNLASLQRSTQAQHDTAPAGETGVPESVREVISSSGRSLDTSIQRAMEDRMGDSLGDVRIHTGPKAAKACEEINARAFTVGNHIAFNSGEYDPESSEGQYLLAHELTHVRQQTGAAISMMPQGDIGLEIDPDPRLEREADEAAKEALSGEEPLIVNRMGTDVHIQRSVDGDGMLYDAVEELDERLSSVEDSVTEHKETINEIEEAKTELQELEVDEEDRWGDTLLDFVKNGSGPAIGALAGLALSGGPAAIASFGAAGLVGTLLNMVGDDGEQLTPEEIYENLETRLADNDEFTDSVAERLEHISEDSSDENEETGDETTAGQSRDKTSE